MVGQPETKPQVDGNNAKPSLLNLNNPEILTALQRQIEEKYPGAFDHDLSEHPDLLRTLDELEEQDKAELG